MIVPLAVKIRWDGVPGATGYQIVVDDQPVAKTGAKARTTLVKVTAGEHTVRIADLPAHSTTQAINLNWRSEGDS